MTTTHELLDQLPARYGTELDLSELLPDEDGPLATELERLGDALDAHVVAYRAGARPHPERRLQLCTLLHAAPIDASGRAQLRAAERRLGDGTVLVAYARPLRWRAL